MSTAYAESLHQDTLRVVRGATSPSDQSGSEQFIANNSRARLGLGPHTEAFRKFIEDQAKINRDPKRPMIGVAVSRYSIWPPMDED